ncbi:MAG: PspA/IM30 family protein [Aeromicrobium sp.]
MSIWKRILRIFRSRKNRDVDDIDGLREKLESSYRSQQALLQRVRRGVADVATSRKRVELQIAQLRQQSAQLDDAARDSVSNGDDDAARASLTRKITLEKTISGLESQHEELKAQEDKLDDSAQDIQTRIEEFRLRKDTLTARQTAAAARSEINSATTGISSSMGSVGQAVEAAEKRTREQEAHADAIDELVKEGIITGPGGDAHSTTTFDQQFDQLSGTVDRADLESVDGQLEALKSGTATGDGHGQDSVQE